MVTMKRRKIVDIKEIKSFETCNDSIGRTLATNIVFNKQFKKEDELLAIMDRINIKRPFWMVLKIDTDSKTLIISEGYTHVIKIMWKDKQPEFYIVKFED